MSIPWFWLWWSLAVLGGTYAVSPSLCYDIFRSVGRFVELAWLYGPLLPSALFAGAVDRLLHTRGSRRWTDVWWSVALRRVQQSGPVFVKLGQWAATRPDLIPETWCARLARLHDSTEPHALAHTHQVLTRSFPQMYRGKTETLLVEPEPIGSGCIAQVYLGFLIQAETSTADQSVGCCAGLRRLWGGRTISSPGSTLPASSAVLRGGATGTSSGSSSVAHPTSRARRVAVKVVHPQVRRAVDIDLKFLNGVAWFCDKLGLDHLGASLAIRQFAAFLAAQIDLRVEADNLRRLGRHFHGNDSVVIPQVFDGWVAEDALVMSFEEGEPLSTLLEAGSESRHLKTNAWATLCDAFWAMVFKYRFVHGDLHPGNILWRRTGYGKVQLVLLDCGLVIDLTGQAGDDLSMMVKAFFTKSEEEVAGLLIHLSRSVGGRLEDVIDRDGFVRGIASLIRQGKGCGFRLTKLNAGALMGQSLLLGRRHRVRFDARFVNLSVAMAVIQGVAMSLYGDGDFLNRMHPYLFGAAMSAAVGGAFI